jgi:hypothetical protein
MKKQLLCFLLSAFCLLLSGFAQNPLPREYWYDNAGNRIIRKLINLNLAPPAPTDSIATELEEAPTADRSPQIADFFVEKIAQTEIKIYPNPTTEKITLEISNMETLQTGMFKLYSLSGQLLQEQPVYAAATEISLAGFAKGTYILKVSINDRIEDWKIIKQ